MAYKMLTHIIHRPILELHFAPGVPVLPIEERIKNAFYNTVPRIEKIFSELDDAEKTIRIERISIDLGSLGIEDIEELFQVRLLQGLSSAIADLIKEQPFNQTHVTPNGSSEFKLQEGRAMDSQLSPNTISGNRPDLSEFLAVEIVLEQTFFYFLLHGSLPWWATNEPDAHLEDSFSPLLTSTPPGFATRLTILLKRNRNSVLRLTYQFTEAFIDSLRNLIRKDIPNEVSAVYDLFMRIDFRDTPVPVKMTSRLFHDWRGVSVEILLSESSYIACMRIDRFLRRWSQIGHLNIPALMENMEAKPLRDYLERKGYHIVNRHGDATVHQHFHVLPQVDNHAPATETKDAMTDRHHVETSSPEDLEKVIYVNKAGLVILHPFFQQFFFSLGLMDAEGQFSNERSRRRAVYLLSFLANGMIAPSESELPFCKFLCGMALDKPVRQISSFTKKEISESGKLLESVISHWSVLKNTSPTGLRESFICRNGKLDLREEVPVLFVEVKAYDILLSRLPWGFGYIQLPWLPTPFTTVWI